MSIVSNYYGAESTNLKHTAHVFLFWICCVQGLDNSKYSKTWGWKDSTTASVLA